MSTVRSSCWARATARLKAMVVLPTPPLGANTDSDPRRMRRRRAAANSFLTPAMRFIRSNPENGIARTAWTPASGSTSTGFWGTVSMMTGTLQTGLLDLLGELGALDPALQQRVDEHDVGAQLADLGRAPCCRR